MPLAPYLIGASMALATLSVIFMGGFASEIGVALWFLHVFIGVAGGFATLMSIRSHPEIEARHPRVRARVLLMTYAAGSLIPIGFLLLIIAP